MKPPDKKLRILAIDDEPDFRFLYQATCQELGYAVDTTGAIEEAMALLKAAAEQGEPYAVAIVDMNFETGKKGIEMPLGKGAIRKIKSLYPDIACILVSGAEITPEQILEMRDEINLDSFLAKDRFDIDTFCGVIEKALERARHNRSLQGAEAMAAFAPLPPEVASQAVMFLIEVGKLAASELKQRWQVARQHEAAGTPAAGSPAAGAPAAAKPEAGKPPAGAPQPQPGPVDLSTSEQHPQAVQQLVAGLPHTVTAAEIQQAGALIKQARKLIFEWRQEKLDYEEMYNRDRISLPALRRNQEDLDEKIARQMAELESYIHALGLTVEKQDLAEKQAAN